MASVTYGYRQNCPNIIATIKNINAGITARQPLNQLHTGENAIIILPYHYIAR